MSRMGTPSGLQKLKPGALSSKHSLIPKRLAVGSRLAGKLNPRDANGAESSKRNIRPQKHFFEVPIEVPRVSEPAQRAHDYHQFEYKMIWAAFDVPERVPIMLRDRLIAGDEDAFSARWLDAAAHWVKEGRYWRCIGIERPFYDRTQLRADTWSKHGTDVGNMMQSGAMIDALRDLERVVQREAQGLPGNYVWDKWGPWGNIDGTRADVLPRFRLNPYVDPDGIRVRRKAVKELTSHAKIKERYGHIIFPDTEPLKGAFLMPTNGCITFDEFPDELKATVARLRKMPADQCAKLSTPDDIRAMLYFSGAPSHYGELLNAATTWDEALEALKPHRAEHDMKIDAARLVQLSRDLDELRTLYEEKCGFADFHMTTDKDLTGATMVHLEDLKRVSTEPWGPQLLRCTIDAQRTEAMGEAAFTVYRELMDLDRDRRRRAWAARFTGSANEEQTLDYMLQNFARRPERAGSANEPGEDFDREKEPIGRSVQRRVLDSDKSAAKSFASASAPSKLEAFAQRVKSQRTKDLLDDVKYNQMIRTSQF
jgi:hypothetical protein